MRWKLLDDGPPATHAVVLNGGDEAVAVLGKFVQERRIEAASLSAIGAFECAVVGYFDWAKKNYKRIPVEDQVEVLSLLGDVAVSEGEPTLHIHAVRGRSDEASSAAICSKAMCGRRLRSCLSSRRRISKSGRTRRAGSR